MLHVHGKADIFTRWSHLFWVHSHKKKIAGQYSSSIFNVFGILHAFFQNSFTNLYYHQWYIRVPFSPKPHQHLLSCIFFIIGILTGARWYLSGFNLHFPDTSDAVVLFIYLMVISMSSVEKCLFMSFAHLLNWVAFLLWAVRVLYKVLDINLLSEVVCKYFCTIHRLLPRFINHFLWHAEFF
jgi:hypothetical protein